MIVCNYKEFKKLNLHGLSIRLIGLYDAIEDNLVSISCNGTKFKDKKLNPKIKNYSLVVDNDIMERIVSVLDKIIIKKRSESVFINVEKLANELCLSLLDHTIEEIEQHL